mgnify:FL=1
MKKATITIAFDQAKLKAIQIYMSKSGTSLESELDTFMHKLYKRYVPSQTREYNESTDDPDERPRPRTARAERSDAAAQVEEGA